MTSDVGMLFSSVIISYFNTLLLCAKNQYTVLSINRVKFPVRLELIEFPLLIEFVMVPILVIVPFGKNPFAFVGS